MRYPGIHVDFRTLLDGEIVSQVAAGMLDAGVVATAQVPPGLEQLRIQVPDAGFSLIVPRGHSLAASREVSVHVLDGERVATLTAPAHVAHRSMASLAEAGCTPASFVGLPGINSVGAAVEMSLAVGFVPTCLALTLGPRSSVTGIRISQIAFTPSLTLICRQRTALPKRTADFVDAVRHLADVGRAPNRNSAA